MHAKFGDDLINDIDIMSGWYVGCSQLDCEWHGP